MKVIQVISTLSSGGAEKMLVDLVEEMQEQGIDCEVAVLSMEYNLFGEKLASLNVPIYYGKSNNIYALSKIWFLLKILKNNHYDCIHSHLFPPQLYTILALKLLKRKIPLVTTEHSTYNRRREKKWLNRLDRWMYKQYDRIIAISNGTKNNLISYLPELQERVMTIHNGINFKPYKEATSLNKAILDPNLKVNDVVVLMVARMNEQKDHETVIRATKLLPRQYKVIFVGNGPREDEIRKYARQYGREDIIFLGERADIPTIMKSSDLFVLSSKSEGFGLVIVEAAASNLPIVASNIDGLREVVEGVGGTLFTPENEQDLAHKIITTYEQKKGPENTKIDMYSISNTVKNYINCYKNIIEEKTFQ